MLSVTITKECPSLLCLQKLNSVFKPDSLDFLQKQQSFENSSHFKIDISKKNNILIRWKFDFDSKF